MDPTGSPTEKVDKNMRSNPFLDMRAASTTEGRNPEDEHSDAADGWYEFKIFSKSRAPVAPAQISWQDAVGALKWSCWSLS